MPETTPSGASSAPWDTFRDRDQKMRETIDKARADVYGRKTIVVRPVIGESPGTYGEVMEEFFKQWQQVEKDQRAKYRKTLGKQESRTRRRRILGR